MEKEILTPSQLWDNYTTHNCRKWLGNWTKWNPMTGNLLESFDTIRHIELINDSRMKHQNTFIYADGRSIDTGPMNGPWEYHKERDCDHLGMMHPSSRQIGIEARAFFLSNGSGVWTMTRVKENKMFFLEIFFPDQSKRCSTGVHYSADGSIMRVSLIREDVRERPGPYWSRETNLKNEYQIKGDFHGTEITLHADLTLTTRRNIEWKADKSLDGYKTINLPDDIMMSFPVTIDPDRSFQVQTRCHYNEEQQNEVREGRVFFVDGVFSHFKLGIYNS